MKRKEAIKQIQEGKIQVFNDLLPSTKEIKKFLKEAFPEDKYIIEENSINFYDKKYFYASVVNVGRWCSSNARKDLPIINLSTITKRKKTKLSQLETLISNVVKGVVDLNKNVSELRQTLAKDVEVDVEEVKSELIVWEWYRRNEGIRNLVFYKSDLNNDSYGFGYADNAYIEKMSFNKKDCNWTKATPQEVQTALENEAKKRGYEKGVVCSFGEAKSIREIKTNEFFYNPEINVLLMGCDGIFQNGIWAEIQQETIKEEEIDYSKSQLFEGINGVGSIIFSNGKHEAGIFQGHCIKIAESNNGFFKGEFYPNLDKRFFKPFKGELTIKPKTRRKISG